MPYFVKHKIISSFKSNHFASMTSFQFDCNPQVPGLPFRPRKKRPFLVDEKSKLSRRASNLLCSSLPLIYDILVCNMYIIVLMFTRVYIDRDIELTSSIYSCRLCYPNYLLWPVIDLTELQVVLLVHFQMDTSIVLVFKIWTLIETHPQTSLNLLPVSHHFVPPPAPMGKGIALPYHIMHERLCIHV